MKNKMVVRNVMEKLMDNRPFKVLLILGIFVMLSSGVIAYYVMSHQSSTTYTITGGVSTFGITADLSPVILDVSANLTDSQQIILENDNSDLNMIYNLTTSVNVTDPGCSGDDDISFELSSDEGIIDSGGNFTMEKGTNIFNFTASAVNDRACPSEIDVVIDFTE